MLHTLPRNPFAMRHTQPGAVRPLDGAGRLVNLSEIVAAMNAHRGTSIEGPHGTGKSTLVAALVKEIMATGRQVRVFRLRRGQDAVPAIRTIFRADRGALVCLDGWEILGALKFVARQIAWWRGVGLLVTAHRPAGFSYVVRTTATLPLLRAVVDQLPDHGGLITDDDLADALDRHPSNIREALCDLYDRFEHRARMAR